MRSALRYAVVLFTGVLGCWLEPPRPQQPPGPPVVCGDGVKAGIEQCDSGPENSDTKSGACRTTCVLAGCGDSVLDPMEVCDDGNRLNGDGCTASCRKIELCGDGIIDPGAEQCDDGAENSDTLANRCRTTCKLPRCGDDVDDRDEECDDGNVANGDSCDSNCTTPRCGNSVIGLDEECDDGNSFNTDACLPNCTKNRCSRGVDSAGNLCFSVRTFPLPDSEMRAVEIADLDGNGWDDIAVVDRDDDTVKVLWNSGGAFTKTELWVAQFYSVSGDDPVDLAIGDIDGDGKLDMATANETKDLVCVLENEGDRKFKRHFIDVEDKPTDLTLANVDGVAGGLEVVVGVEGDDEVRVIRMSQFGPYGTPQVMPASNPASLTSGDVDGDGDKDIVWSGSAPVLGVNEGGTLVKNSVANGQSTDAIKLWDLDGTPPVELVTGVYGLFTSEHLRVFQNSDTTNATVFDTHSDYPVKEWPVYLARFGSGVVYADNGGTFGVLRNEQGALVEEQTFTYDGDAEGLASGDLDKDGSPDIVIISPDKKAVLIFMGKSP